MEDALAAGAHDVAAVIAVGVMEETRAPVVGWRVDDFEQVELQLVPDPHLVGGGKSEFSNKRAAALGHDDALAGLEDLEARLVEVVEMRVGDEHQIDFRQAVQVEPGLAAAFHRAVPFRPVGIDDHRVAGELQEERGMADPGDAHLVRIRRREHGFEHVARAAAEHAGHHAVAQEAQVARRPAALRQDAGIAPGVQWRAFRDVPAAVRSACSVARSCLAPETPRRKPLP